MSHLLAFVFRVTGLEPTTVACTMVASPITGADIYDSAVVTCTNGATISLSGTAAVCAVRAGVFFLVCLLDRGNF